MQLTFPALRNVTFAIIGLAASLVTATASDTYKWTVQYLIDNSQSVNGQSQKVWPRRNRGIALSPDGKFLYAGYHQASNGAGEVRKIAVGIPEDYGRATTKVLPGPLGKSIATDDKGRVYIANEGAIVIYDDNLSQIQFSVEVALCEGVAVVREGNSLSLFATDRQVGTISKWTLEEKGGLITGATPAKGFGEDGTVLLKGAASLRGVEIDSKGRVWAADTEAGRIFRLSADGKSMDSADVLLPMDIAFDGDRAFVTRSADRAIAVFEMESMKLLGNLAIPWDELEIHPTGNNRRGSLSGIAVIPGKGFFVSNESGQTLDQKSTYGRADSHTDLINGKLYRDAIMDDNDPILQALVVPGGN